MKKNRYQNIYNSFKITINQDTTCSDAQKIIKELGYMYNAMGKIIQDIIKLLSLKFQASLSSHIQKEKKDEKKKHHFPYPRKRKVIDEESMRNLQIINFEKPIISNIIKDASKQKNFYPQVQIQSQLSQKSEWLNEDIEGQRRIKKKSVCESTEHKNESDYKCFSQEYYCFQDG